MNYLYKFTPDEQRVIIAAQQRLEITVSAIAELHHIKGNLIMAPDYSGLLAPDAPAAAPHVNGAALTPEVIK